MLTYNEKFNKTVSISGITDPNCTITYENHKVSKTILLIGNGFDLRAKIKSSFNDFIVFIIYGCILHNSYNNIYLKDKLPEIIQNQKENLKTLPEQLNILLNKFDSNIYKSCHEFAETLLGKEIFTHIFSPYFYFAFILLSASANVKPILRYDKKSLETLCRSDNLCLQIGKRSINICPFFTNNICHNWYLQALRKVKLIKNQ